MFQFVILNTGFSSSTSWFLTVQKCCIYKQIHSLYKYMLFYLVDRQEKQAFRLIDKDVYCNSKLHTSS